MTDPWWETSTAGHRPGKAYIRAEYPEERADRTEPSIHVLFHYSVGGYE